jgi:predicted Zn-dependent protease
MLSSLDADHKLQLILANRAGEPETSDFFSTHPNTQDRVTRAHSAAAQTQIPENSRNRNQNLYYNIIDSMMWGDDPKQGMIKGRDFIHSAMKLKFTVPENFTLRNSLEAVLAQGTGDAEGSTIIFSGANTKDMSISTYASEIWKAYKIEATLENLQEIQVNNTNAVTGSAVAMINN